MQDRVVIKSDTVPVRSTEDVVKVRQEVRAWAIREGLSLTDQTKIVTAASELARNTVVYGGGGTLLLETLSENGRRGVRLTFEDHGPGIPDIQQAMRDGYTTGGGLGLGLSGSKRLSHQFDVQSEVGKGTRVIATRWK